MPPRPDPQEIEAVLLGGEALYTREEAVRRAGARQGLPWRIWRALGFTTRDDGEPAFTESDVEALRITSRLLEEHLLDEEAAVRMARAMGQTMARLAEWQTSILTTLSHPPETADESGIS